jgi:superfamily II DNA/RNA helicase
MNFADMTIRDELKRALDELGFVTPTPIQELAIPLALEDRDVLGVAQTGTGKTLAFLVPILDKLEPKGEVQALVVCPTRELAQQVGKVAETLGAKLGVKTTLLYGGTGLGGQRQALEDGVDIVVGTPGRLIDFLGSAWFRPRWVRWLVLDEADRMLDMGFIDDVRRICSRVPLSRQTMLFSATMPPPIAELADKFMMHPETVRIAPKQITAEGIEQRMYLVHERDKRQALVQVLEDFREKKALVFTATREATSEVARDLRRAGHEVVSLSSLLSQNNRERALAGFREGEYEIMVATDVAARGLDVIDIDLVVNYDLPQSAEDYVHRIGRTGRAERKGVAVSFATPQESHRLQAIDRLLREPVPRLTLDGIDEAKGGGRSRGASSGRRGGPPRGGRSRGRGGRGRSRR